MRKRKRARQVIYLEIKREKGIQRQSDRQIERKRERKRQREIIAIERKIEQRDRDIRIPGVREIESKRV